MFYTKYVGSLIFVRMDSSTPLGAAEGPWQNLDAGFISPKLFVTNKNCHIWYQGKHLCPTFIPKPDFWLCCNRWIVSVVVSNYDWIHAKNGVYPLVERCPNVIVTGKLRAHCTAEVLTSRISTGAFLSPCGQPHCIYLRLASITCRNPWYFRNIML